MSLDTLLEFGGDVASTVVTEAASSSFGDVFLSGLDAADALLGEQLGGSLLDQAGSYAGSGSFWDTFNPGDIYDNVTASITDFFNPNEGIALTQQFAGQTPGTTVGGLLSDAYTSVTDFFSPNAGIGLTQDILATNSAAGVLNDPYSLTSLAQQGQDLISAAGGSANPLNDFFAKATGLVSDQTFNLGTVLKIAQAVGPQAVSALFGGGTTGQLAGQVFRVAAAQVSGATNPQVLGPNAGPQLPISRGTTVFDNSYGGGSAAEYNAINYSIQAQQIQDADAGVAQAQDNFNSQQRTYEAATESYNQASASVEAYDRLLAESGLSEQEIADLTAQRDAAAAQLDEARYQVQISQQDLAAASDQLDNANNQYDSAVASANAQNLSPVQDPSNPVVVNNPVNVTATPGTVAPGSTGYLTTAAINQAAQFIRTAAANVTDVANLPAATIANFRTVLAATGVDPNSDQFAATVQALADGLIAQGLSANIVNSLVSTVNADTQGLRDLARFQVAARAQQQNPAKTGDWRVRLSLAPNSNYLYNIDGGRGAGILQPLYNTNGVIFPYTPKVDTVYKADYEAYNLTHSNYRGYFYKGSYVDNISVQATFTAQDTSEADYLLAVIHFFRSATKMFYGQDALRGAPPPLVFLSGYGEYQFNNHPCVISSFNYNLPADVDYIRARSSFTNGTNFLLKRDRSPGVASNPLSYALQRLSSVGLPKGAQPDRVPPPTLGINNPNYVPTKMEISLTLYPVQSRQQVSKQFSLQNFANGNLLKGGFW